MPAVISRVRHTKLNPTCEQILFDSVPHARTQPRRDLANEFRRSSGHVTTFCGKASPKTPLVLEDEQYSFTD